MNTINSNSLQSIDMRKKETKSALSAADRRLLQVCLDNRNKIHQGLRLLKSIIHESSSRLVISVCSFLAKKIQTVNR